MSVAKMCTNGYWAVNGSPIYVPDDINISHDNVVGPDSGRVESGIMRITWVRRDVAKIELTYKKITGAEVAYMRNLMQGQEFVFTYYDNGIRSINGYTGKCDYNQKDLSQYASDGGLCKDFKINVVEM